MVVLVTTFVLAVLIGVTLGLLGGGGAILLVPALTYVAGLPPRDAITISLFVVALTSAASVVGHGRAGRVMWRTGAIVGAAGMAGAFAGSRFSHFASPRLLMLSLAAMMLVAGAAMLRGRFTQVDGELATGKAIAFGAAIGVATGFVGVGGGFLIVPMLVVLGRVPMERAIGTSLLVIAMSSSVGFVGHLDEAVDWQHALPVAALAIAGSLVGGKLVTRVSPAALRKVFAVVVIVVAVVVIAKELHGA